MTHTKRNKVPRNWPIKRKGTKYVIGSNSNGIPLTILFRDLLKICANKKEVKKAINLGRIFVNGEKAKTEKDSVVLFDKISIFPSEKYYNVSFSKYGKYTVEEIDKKEIDKKVSKIISKKKLRGNKIQINLMDGRNFISDLKCSVGDSVLIDLKKKKIEKCLPLKEKAEVLIFGGKHAGVKGKINKINLENKNAEIKSEKDTLDVLIKQIIVIE
jgi:small subunit ribosomal protein S4e